jgi:hypothetical protein
MLTMDLAKQLGLKRKPCGNYLKSQSRQSEISEYFDRFCKTVKLYAYELFYCFFSSLAK